MFFSRRSELLLLLSYVVAGVAGSIFVAVFFRIGLPFWQGFPLSILGATIVWVVFVVIETKLGY